MASKRRRGDSEKAEKKKRKSCEEAAALCSAVEDERVRRAVKEAWSRRSHYNLELDCHPFPHCIIRNFLRCQAFVDSLQRELLQLNFHEKSNDLYKKRTEPHIAGLRAALFGRFRSWLGEVLGVELEPTVDISCAKYEYTDVLLCHDDELEGRRVAFILYLVPPWQSSDGGTLDLYSTDSNFQPQTIVKSLVPSSNTLILFEVSPVSFHQESVLLEWVNPVYLDISYQEQIQKEFEENSEIQLKDFLKDEKFREVSEALRLTQIQWTRRGPPNKRCYEVASLDTLPQCVSACWQLLHSEAFFLLLSNFTGLRLHYLCPADDDDEEDKNEMTEEKKEQEDARDRESTGSLNQSPSANTSGAKELSTPVCCGELRRWCWQSDFGGFTCYVANEEDEELLTVYPEDNSLALVYRDKETLKFVKHVNHKSFFDSTSEGICRTLYDFSFVYYE
uniref:Prolyl 4-hydroxylase alpha subunit domain-containing protein n=1 Tax=Mola mola TaxID=94237 RepID=A0A3Q4BLW6_MOLML